MRGTIPFTRIALPGNLHGALAALCFLVLFVPEASARIPYWSKTGHRVIGQVAEEHLSRRAKKAIEKILHGQNLASVSNYADEIKADRAYKAFSAWHYVNYPEGREYGDVEPSPHGDVVTGIEKCLEILANDRSAKADKAFYLKMLIHLVGDLHQPMHVGRLEDKGGNDIQLRWFGRGTNLHRLWDANMIDDYGMSYTELSDALPDLSREQIKDIQKGSVRDWVKESHELANELYKSVRVGEKLSYQYSYTHWEIVEQQLQNGGLRLAPILNDLFG